MPPRRWKSFSTWEICVHIGQSSQQHVRIQRSSNYISIFYIEIALQLMVSNP